MRFNKWIFLLSTATILADVPTRDMEIQQSDLVEQNAKLTEAQNQLTDINSDPAKKLAYLQQFYKGLTDRDEYERANKSDGPARTEALEKIYRKKQRENTDLIKKQNEARENPSINSAEIDEINRKLYAEEQERIRTNSGQEVDEATYKAGYMRGIDPDKEVSAYDIRQQTLSVRNAAREPHTASPDAFQNQTRTMQTITG